MICSNKSVWDISTTLRLKITQKQNCEHSTRESERVWSLFWRLLSTGRINVVDLNKTPDRQLDPREHFTSEGSGQVSFLVLFLTHTQRATTAHLYILCWAADPAGASSTRSALLFGSQCGLFIKVCGRSESRHLSEERFFLQTVEAEGWDQDGFTFFWMNCSFKDLTTPVGLLGNRKSCDCSECIEQAADFLCQTIRTWTCVCVCVMSLPPLVLTSRLWRCRLWTRWRWSPVWSERWRCQWWCHGDPQGGILGRGEANPPPRRSSVYCGSPAETPERF